MSIIDEIAAERRRQVEEEGWSLEHDDEHDRGELAVAAACYAKHAADFRDALENGVTYRTKATPPDWPWDRHWWKPENARRDLIRAGALIVAEIERLDRLAEWERLQGKDQP